MLEIRSPLLRRGRRGNILAITFAVIFILLTVVSALHYQQSTARRKLTRASAYLQFSQARKFETLSYLQAEGMVPHLTETKSAPDWVKVYGSNEVVHDGRLESQAGSKLFTGLDNLAVHKSDDPVAFHQHLSMQPKSSDNALRVFSKRTWKVALRRNDGYALYAPKGSLYAGALRGWANPTFKDERADMANCYSGVPAWARAQKTIRVREFAYGFGSSSEGPIDFDDGLGVPMLGPGPIRDYDSELSSRLETVKNTMDGRSRNGDKTGNIKGTIFSNIGNFFKMMVGQADFDEAFSPTIQQAVSMNIPMIPGFSNTVPGLFYEIWLHVPFPSDGVSYQSQEDVENGKKTAEKLKEKNDELEAQKKETARLEKELSNTSNEDKRDELKEKIKDSKKKERDIREEIGDLQDEIEDEAEAANNKVKDKTPSSGKDPPTTRAEDEDTPIPKTGTNGWNYSSVLSKMLELVWGIVRGKGDEIVESIAPSVRLVHFGDRDHDADTTFDFSDNTFTSEATWTVPQGRTFRYGGDMEIIGDLWIQKGAIFSVGGDLTISKPPGSSANPFAPKGRLILEEGASLIVDGDFEAWGTPTFGSVLVASRPNQIHTISSAILASGDVTLRYGTFPAMTLADGIRWVAEEINVPEMADVADTAEEVFANVAPNLSKIAGPFHLRKPYFARYATTFQLTVIPPPIGPIPIPSAIPMPRRNGLVGVFRALTFLYTPTLNWSLGENLYTQCDWWYFGQGQVPVLPKLDPDGAIASLRSFSLGNYSFEIDWDDVLSAFAKDVLEDIATRVLVKAVTKIGAKIIVSVLPGAGIIIDNVIAEVEAALDEEFGSLEDLVSDLVKDAMEPIIRPFTDILEDVENRVQTAVQDVYLRELPGILIYANNITVGSSPLSQGTVSSNSGASAKAVAGMLVAKQGMNLNCKFAVGTFTALNGDILANTVQYVPYFGSASLYLPKELSTSDWITRGGHLFYGKSNDSELSLDVETKKGRAVFEGWSQ